MEIITVLLLGLLGLVVTNAAQTCPSTGIACYPGDCGTQFQQCSGTTFWPVEACAAGTMCYEGQIIATNPSCSSGTATSAPTAAPTRAPTPAPTSAPTTRAPTPAPTSATTTRAPTGAPTGAPTKAPTAGPTTAATATPTKAATPVPTGAPTAAPTTTSTCSLANIFSQAQFTYLFPHANGGYINGVANQYGPFTYANLIQAAQTYPAFACTGDLPTRQRELAAFLGQTSHETSGWWSGQPWNWGYYYSSELNGPSENYCDPSNTAYPCLSSDGYYGRGPIQLSWNYNYGAASQALFGDATVLLNNPQQVVTNGVTSFQTALWFWMTAQSPKPSPHNVMTGAWTPSPADTAAGRVAGYGLVIDIVNGGIECGIPTPAQVTSRVTYYQTYLTYFGVSDVGSDYCNTMQPY